MPAIGRDGFKTKRKPRIERIELDEWLGEGDFVWAKAISAKDLRDLRLAQGAEPELGHMAFVYDLLKRSLCDEDGVRLFETDGEVQEAFELPVDALERVADRVLEISRVGKKEKN